MTRRVFGWVALLATALALSACGFQLRGASEYAFQRLYISGGGQMAVDISRYIRYGSKGTVVVSDPKDADARLEVIGVTNSRTAVSLDANGQAREYEMRSAFTFQLVTPDGRPIIPLTTIRLVRNLPYSDSESNARDAEAALLNRDMQKDAVDQIIRRMEAVKEMPDVKPEE
ncbi:MULTISPECIES: LPS assembly lipoprotein LptE [Pandoraea]|uniref:LPS-assembly lipoprotein LptE n=1 Tax=Pandoraea capi TaxID=2508286 RepID=A0ABY6VP60_9BURK|nr:MULTISPECIES: LPS assembly lipoprotein LptE [Pandoraea]VVD71118.1 LPS-assembly lipoprotein LptE [Pandoraea capi]